MQASPAPAIATLPRFGGFADKVLDAQSTFRAVMDAMANPGRIETVSVVPNAPGRLAPALAAAALTLIDNDTPVFLDAALAADGEIAAFLSFHAGCRFVDEPARSAFALIGEPARLADLAVFAQGTLEYPDRSTTLLLQLDTLSDSGELCLSGPGIRETRSLGLAPLPQGFSDQLRANRQRFPQGVDLVFCSGERLAALPRSTRVEG